MARIHTPTTISEPGASVTGDTHPRPPTLESVLPQLIASFFSNQVYVKPGALTRERNRALAMIYLDRRAIAQRLDDLVGARNWTAVPQPWGDNGVIMQDLAVELLPSSKPITDPRVALAEVRTHFAQLGPVSPTVGEQVERDRQSRADILEGIVQESDVYD